MVIDHDFIVIIVILFCISLFTCPAILILSNTKKNIGVLITDHNVRETLKIIDKVYIVNEGGIYFEGSPDEAVRNENIKKFYLGSDFKI